MASTSGNNVEQRYLIAISPFGKEIVIFDYVSHILKTWRFTQDMIAIPTNFECELREDIGIKTEEINWSLAISDADSDGNTLIALSCIKFIRANNDISKEIDIITNNKNENEINEINKQQKSTKIFSVDSKYSNKKTEISDRIYENNINNLAMKILNSIQINSIRVVSTSGNKIWHKIKNFYGFLQFFQGNMLLISNHLGIVRGLCIDNKSDIDDLTNLYSNYNSSKRRLKLKNVNVYEKYWKPIYIIEKPSYMDNDKRKPKSKYARYYEKWFNRYNEIDKPLFIYQDLYYPRTFNKQFKKHIINYHEQSESYDKEEKKFYEIFGYPSDFINNLEVLDEEDQLNFVKNCVVCGKLFILNEENNIEMYNLLSKNIDMLYHHSDFQTKLANNIFTISKNAKLLAVTINSDSIALYLNENSLNIANKKFTSTSMISKKIIYMTFFNDDNKLLLLKEDKVLIIWNIFEDSEKIYLIDENVQIIDLFGIIAFINNSGNIQLFHEKNLKEFDETRQEILMNNYSSEKLELLKLSESITRNYNKRERRIMDTEPWLDLNHYQTSYWLNYSKTLRISYGFYTIQIWENDELIYIWSDYNIDDYNLSNKISTQYIELLDISQDDNGNITSKFKFIDVEHELQISKLVNKFFTKDHAIGAYNSLIFFSKLKLTNISYKLKIDEFLEKTKRIIYNVIIKNPNLWRLLDVRYNLMENLIYSQSNDIIKFILNSTEEIKETKENVKRNQKLHIPQLYDWNGNIRSNHELLIALKENNVEVIQQITNYYSCNAIENTGWMITLTRALPELNKKLPEYVIKLFKESVFSQKQMHLKKSRIKSILATNSSYNIFIVDTRLPSITKKEYQNQSFSHRDSEHSNDYLNDNIKIRMIPLPDFSKYVEISGIKQIVPSPFFELMSERHSNLIYNNSTIETIINFYWNTHTFRITLPKLILYVIYFIGINAHLLLFSFYPIYRSISRQSNIGGILASLQSIKFLNFMGSETKRTFYYYIFYSFSYALLVITLYLFDVFSNLNIVVILVTFTMLILWVEFFLFLRIIPVVGEYIFIITFLISKVIPYFLTMMIMVFGFGFSMFILFSNAAILGIKPQSDEYQFSNITIQQKIDSPNFFETLEMVYLWLFGDWDDVKNWDYIPIKILALLASFFIVIIMQNIFVALMAEDISTARNYSVIASLKSKTDYIIQTQYQNYYYLRNFGSYFYLSTESSFNFRFYHLTTFNSTYNRHIFYTVNRNNIKNWITIGENDGVTSNDSEFSGNINELVEKISDRQLFLENEVHKLNEKFDKLLELLNKK